MKKILIVALILANLCLIGCNNGDGDSSGTTGIIILEGEDAITGDGIVNQRENASINEALWLHANQSAGFSFYQNLGSPYKTVQGV